MAASHRNNFDFLRLAAAIFVWYSHCYALTGRSDPLGSIIHFNDFGSLGVTIFFIISGYFIPASYLNHDSLLGYAKNRALRILPALCAVVLLSVFVLGPLMTSLSFYDYFTSGTTWGYLRSVLIFPLQYKLPGVFTHNANDAVNGSLWTLKQEVRLYGYVALFGFLGILRPRVMLCCLALLLGMRLYSSFYLQDATALLGWKHLQVGKEATRLAFQFACGTLLYLARDTIKLKKEIFLLSLVIIIASVYWQSAISHPAFDLAFSYVVIYLGFLRLPLLPELSRLGDFSYGVYLYAFPIQQIWVQLLGTHADLNTFMLASFPCVLLCAILSWHLVEKPALAHKS